MKEIKTASTDDNRVLEDIRRLLILFLMKKEVATSSEIGHALGVDASTVRHLIVQRKKR